MNFPEYDMSDEYARVTAEQNAGHACIHCHADSGHFSNCPLLAFEYRTLPDVLKMPVTQKELQTIETYRNDVRDTPDTFSVSLSTGIKF